MGKSEKIKDVLSKIDFYEKHLDLLKKELNRLRTTTVVKEKKKN